MLNEHQEEDLKLIKDIAQWPNIILAMVNRANRQPGGMPECGFLTQDNDHKLYLKNMFDLDTGPLSPQLVGVPVLEFDSVEAMLEAGWEVD